MIMSTNIYTKSSRQVHKEIYAAYFKAPFKQLLIGKKCKVVPVLSQLGTTPWRCTGEWMCSSTILDVVTSSRWVVSFTLRPLFPRYPLDRRLGLNDTEKIKFLILPGHELRSLGRPARDQSLYRLPYPGSLERLVICSRFQSLNPGPQDTKPECWPLHGNTQDFMWILRSVKFTYTERESYR
jgi:hypothetical protein